MRNNLSLVKRLGVLSVLVFCLGFVMFAPNTAQNAMAARCCSECPIPLGQVEPTPEEYCQDQCQVRNGPCFDACVGSVYGCWRTCNLWC